MHAAINFKRLKTPATHGDTLVEPEARQLALIVQRNRAQLAEQDITLGGVPWSTAREAARSAVCASSGPLIVTGHQPEFIHAGVWAKHVVAMRLAEAVGGSAVNLVVDHDAPARLAFSVPRITDDALRLIAVRYGAWPRGAAIEGMPPLEADAIGRMRAEVSTSLGDHYAESLMPRYFDALQAADPVQDWVDQTVAARRAVESTLGITLADRRVSDCWCGPLLCNLLGDACRFASAYNDALADYRRRLKIRGAQRPIPDLQVDGDLCETALWAYRIGEPRTRLFVRRSGSMRELLAGNTTIARLDIAQLNDWTQLREALTALCPWRIRPRALTLTLWARLLVADLFIHGIGGAKYDRITDDIIRRYFGIEPPGMACVSATLGLDIPVPEVMPVDVLAAEQRLRDVRFNAPRYLAPDALPTLRRARDDLIAQSKWLRGNAPHEHDKRRSVFDQIQAINAAILAEAGDVVDDLERRRDRLREDLRRRNVARHRELFFAVLSRDSLAGLLDVLPGVAEFRAAAIVQD